MNKKFWMAIVTLPLLAPSGRAWANEKKSEERAEPVAVKQREEMEAMEKYQKAAAAHGRNSDQATRAWSHVVAEYKEHGDPPPTPPAASAAKP